MLIRGCGRKKSREGEGSFGRDWAVVDCSCWVVDEQQPPICEFIQRTDYLLGLRCCHTEKVAEATVVGSEKKVRGQKRSGPMLLGIKAVEGDRDRYDPWRGRSDGERLVGRWNRAGWDYWKERGGQRDRRTDPRKEQLRVAMIFPSFLAGGAEVQKCRSAEI